MKILLKILILGASLATNAAARKALLEGWLKETGNEPPTEANDLNIPLAGVLVLALVTAATESVIQVITQRLAGKTTLKLEHNPSQP